MASARCKRPCEGKAGAAKGAGSALQHSSEGGEALRPVFDPDRGTSLGASDQGRPKKARHPWDKRAVQGQSLTLRSLAHNTKTVIPTTSLAVCDQIG